MKIPSRFAVAVALLSLVFTVPSVHAHDWWLDVDGAGFGLLNGHGKSARSYAASTTQKSLTRLVGLSSAGDTVPVTSAVQGNQVKLVASAPVSSVGAVIDGGSWLRTSGGLRRGVRPVGKSEPAAYRAHSFARLIVAPGPANTHPMGAVLEIVPAQDPMAPGRKGPLPVTVLLQGRPLKGASLEGGHHEVVGTTDAAGRVIVRELSSPTTSLSVHHKIKVEEPATVDFEKAAATLVIVAP